MPVRIQRRRTAGWRMPETAVSVTRPSKWGNPFVVTTKVRPGVEFSGAAHGCISVPTAEDAVECYRLMLAERPDLVEAARAELAGKDLACFCAFDQPCHADVLLEIANGPG
jgi:hypothetical protein